jgi:hypothetical protein
LKTLRNAETQKRRERLDVRVVFAFFKWLADLPSAQAPVGVDFRTLTHEKGRREPVRVESGAGFRRYTVKTGAA